MSCSEVLPIFVYEVVHPQHSVDSLINELGLSWAWAWNGDKGVDVFFVMSGFLISGILMKQLKATGSIGLRNFYVRRYLRLTPAYYFALCAYWFMNGPHSEWLWANFLYVSNFIHYSHQAMGWTWSLAVEEQFYFIYPLLLVLIIRYSKKPGYVLLGIFLSSFLIRYGVIVSDEFIRNSPSSRMYSDKEYFNHFFTVLYDNLYTRFGAMVVGCMMAYCFHYYREKLEEFANSPAGVITTIVGVFMILFFMIFPIWSSAYDEQLTLHFLYNIFNRNLFSLGIGIVIIATLLQKHLIADILRRFFSSPIWYPMATLSYSLYLIHLVVMSLIIPAIVNLTTMMPEEYPWSILESPFYSFVISTVLSMAISALIYLFIEKPVMNLRK
ncbi:MAG: acyltransferase family protein [Gammaproteobacteria bacterium]|nr:acyltransferase family protein [Gammaproteobacteria bacterium]